jgi:hypothetical protein
LGQKIRAKAKKVKTISAAFFSSARKISAKIDQKIWQICYESVCKYFAQHLSPFLACRLGATAVALTHGETLTFQGSVTMDVHR